MGGGSAGGGAARPMPSQMPRMLGAPGASPVAGMPQQPQGIGAYASRGAITPQQQMLQALQNRQDGARPPMPPLAGVMPGGGVGLPPGFNPGAAPPQISHPGFPGMPGAGGTVAPPNQSPMPPGLQQLMNNPRLRQMFANPQMPPGGPSRFEY